MSDSPSTGNAKVWGEEILSKGNYPSFDYTEVKESPAAYHNWLQSIFTHGFALLKNSPLDPQKTKEICEKIGILRSSIFGSFWDMTVNKTEALEYADTAYSTHNLEPHTDGSYCVDPPGLQAFHVVEQNCTGGETVLLDGWKAALSIRDSHPETFKYLSTQNMEYYYSDKYHSIKYHPKIINLNEKGEIFQIRHNNDDRGAPPMSFSHQQMTQYFKAHKTWMDELSKSEHRINFSLAPGTILITNNWRVLHGRKSFHGSRRLVGSYIPMEIFMSAYRVGRRSPFAKFYLL